MNRIAQITYKTPDDLVGVVDVEIPYETHTSSKTIPIPPRIIRHTYYPPNGKPIRNVIVIKPVTKRIFAYYPPKGEPIRIVRRYATSKTVTVTEVLHDDVLLVSLLVEKTLGDISILYRGVTYRLGNLNELRENTQYSDQNFEWSFIFIKK